MTKSTITRERLEQLANFKGAPVTRQEEQELARMALAAMDRDQVRNEHAKWSQATFGDVGPVGPLKHLSKEALEAAAEPDDLSEWADMQFLLWDAQRRAGITDEHITQAMIEKLAVNKQREWPEPKDGEPRLHIKAQPAQVTEREPIAWLNDAYLARGVVDGEAGSEDAGPGYIPVYREAQPAQVVPEEMTPQQASRSYGGEVRGYRDGWNACRAAMLQAEPVTTANKLPPNSFTDDELEGMAHGNNPQSNAYRELLAYRRNSPVIPDTWIPVSEQMPENDESKPIAIFTGKCLGQGIFVATYDDNGFFDFWEGMEIIGVTHWMPLPAAPQEVSDA